MDSTNGRKDRNKIKSIKVKEIYDFIFTTIVVFFIILEVQI